MKSDPRNAWLCSVKFLWINELEKPAFAGFFYAHKVLAQRGTVIVTALLRKTLRNPEYERVGRSNFIEIKETGSNEENH